MVAIQSDSILSIMGCCSHAPPTSEAAMAIWQGFSHAWPNAWSHDPVMQPVQCTSSLSDHVATSAAGTMNTKANRDPGHFVFIPSYLLQSSSKWSFTAPKLWSHLPWEVQLEAPRPPEIAHLCLVLSLLIIWFGLFCRPHLESLWSETRTKDKRYSLLYSHMGLTSTLASV